MRHSSPIPRQTVTIVNAWNDQAEVNNGRGTPCTPFSPPVTSVHLYAISNAICENASVSNEKYKPRRRRMISAITAASTTENATQNNSATISFGAPRSMTNAAA